MKREVVNTKCQPGAPIIRQRQIPVVLTAPNLVPSWHWNTLPRFFPPLPGNDELLTQCRRSHRTRNRTERNWRSTGLMRGVGRRHGCHQNLLPISMFPFLTDSSPTFVDFTWAAVPRKSVPKLGYYLSLGSTLIFFLPPILCDPSSIFCVLGTEVMLSANKKLKECNNGQEVTFLYFWISNHF